MNSWLDLNLFAGSGGLALGLQRSGFGPTLLFERDKFSCRTLVRNRDVFPRESHVVEADLKNFAWKMPDLPVRLIAAGVPCQPFSLAGKHLAYRDARNGFPILFSAVRNLQPQAVLVENVPGLLRAGLRPYFEYVLKALECPSLLLRPGESWRQHNRRLSVNRLKRGYTLEYVVSWSLLEAADFGVPQRRKRLFIFGLRTPGIFRPPPPTHSFAALARAQEFGEYWQRHSLPYSIPVQKVLGIPVEGHLKPWVTVRDALSGLPEPALSEEKAADRNHWIVKGARSYRGHSGSVLDLPSKAIKAGVHGVPGGENSLTDASGKLRYYTLREAARIQTFPDEYVFFGERKHITRQIGNAVPCALAAAVGAALFARLALESAAESRGRAEERHWRANETEIAL